MSIMVANTLAIFHCAFDLTAHTPFLAAESAQVLWVFCGSHALRHIGCSFA